jgi:hypothetical protein
MESMRALGVACDALSRTATLDADLANGLYDYVEASGVLVSAGEVGSNLYPLFEGSLARPRDRP